MLRNSSFQGQSRRDSSDHSYSPSSSGPSSPDLSTSLAASTSTNGQGFRLVQRPSSASAPAPASTSTSTSAASSDAPLGSSNSPHKIRFGRFGNTPKVRKQPSVPAWVQESGPVPPGYGAGVGSSSDDGGHYAGPAQLPQPPASWGTASTSSSMGSSAVHSLAQSQRLHSTSNQQLRPSGVVTGNPSEDIVGSFSWQGQGQAREADLRQVPQRSQVQQQSSPSPKKRRRNTSISETVPEAGSMSSSFLSGFSIRKPPSPSPSSTPAAAPLSPPPDLHKPQPKPPPPSSNDFASQLSAVLGQTLGAAALFPVRLVHALLTLPAPILAPLLIVAAAYFALSRISIPTPLGVVRWMIPNVTLPGGQWLPSGNILRLPACVDMPPPVSWTCKVLGKDGGKNAAVTGPQIAKVASEVGTHARRAQTVFQSVLHLGREEGLALHHTEIWELAYAVRASEGIEDKEDLSWQLGKLGDSTRDTKDNLIDINARGLAAFEWIVHEFERVELILKRMQESQTLPPPRPSRALGGLVPTSLIPFSSAPEKPRITYTRTHLTNSLDTLYLRLSTELTSVADLIEKAIPVAARASEGGGVVLGRFEIEKARLLRARDDQPLWKYLLDTGSWRGTALRRDVELTTSTVRSLRGVTRDLEGCKEFLRTFRNHLTHFKSGMIGFKLGNDQLDPEQERLL